MTPCRFGGSFRFFRSYLGTDADHLKDTALYLKRAIEAWWHWEILHRLMPTRWAPTSYNPSEIGELTPPKFNMEPENQPLEKEIPIGNPSFSGSMLNFGGVLTL